MVLADEISQIIKYTLYLQQKRQTDYIHNMPIHFRHLKKGSYIKKEILNACLREIIRYEAFAKSHDRDLKTVYTTENHYKLLNNTGKNSVLFIKKGSETVDIKQQATVDQNHWKFYKFNQDSYFLYDKSITIELNKLLLLYGLISYFGKKQNNKPIEIISSNNLLEFFVNENKIKSSFDLQLTKIDGSFPEILDKKIHEFSLMQIGKKGRWKRRIL